MSETPKLTELLGLSDLLCAEDAREDKNLFEMADLKEFRHSSILAYLLGRTERGEFVHLRNFLLRFLGGDQLPKLESPTVGCEVAVDCDGRKRPIDILVEDGDFVLIVENKCRGAADQDSQLQDYWAGVKKLGDASQNVFVLYLPPLNAFDGPSDRSLGNLKNRFATGGDLAGHLVVASYRELVLPWLKEDVLPNVCFGSGSLVSSLRCYIDLLEGAYGERDDNRDVRKKLRAAFSKECKTSDPTELYRKTGDWLDQVEKAKAEASEAVANRLDALRSALWRVRKVLCEENPLLDTDNMSYEVYWFLRKNPTGFAAKFVRGDLDSGVFFGTGRKQSAWDSVQGKIDGREHWLEVWFKADAFKRFCEGEDADDILTFGIGEADEGERYGLPDTWRLEYFAEKRWLSVAVANEAFASAKGKTGGDMLWEIAAIVAAKSREFSDAISGVRR